jgi:hypothetical protein
MENSIPVPEQLWLDQQYANRARIQREGRKVLNWFLLTLALTAITVAVAAYLASHF